jgi:hypothetical protein
MFRNLDHNSDTPARAPRSCSVQSLGTTATAPLLNANSEWIADLEYVWRSRVADATARLQTRARRYKRIANALPDDVPRYRVKCLRSAEWADHRARALAMSRADVVESCNKRWRAIACGCGMRELLVGCDQPQLCGSCRRKHSRKWQKKISGAMALALKHELASYYRTPSYRRRGAAPGIYLITLTGPHAGDFSTDRDRMGVAVRKLLKHANKYEWWRTYALTWEATMGEDGKGHLHAHLAVISTWIPYRRRELVTDETDIERWDSESPNARARPPRVGKRQYTSERGLHDVWRDAMPGALVLDVQPPRRSSNQASSAAYYLAKYVTKGVDPSEFTGRKAGELLVAFRCRRKVTTSAHFWEVPITGCECCGERWRSLGAPMSLQQLAPGAVLRSLSERTKWRWEVTRGPPQVGIRWAHGRNAKADSAMG